MPDASQVPGVRVRAALPLIFVLPPVHAPTLRLRTPARLLLESTLDAGGN